MVIRTMSERVRVTIALFFLAWGAHPRIVSADERDYTAFCEEHKELIANLGNGIELGPRAADAIQHLSRIVDLYPLVLWLEKHPDVVERAQRDVGYNPDFIPAPHTLLVILEATRDKRALPRAKEYFRFLEKEEPAFLTKGAEFLMIYGSDDAESINMVLKAVKESDDDRGIALLDGIVGSFGVPEDTLIPEPLFQAAVTRLSTANPKWGSTLGLARGLWRRIVRDGAPGDTQILVFRLAVEKIVQYDWDYQGPVLELLEHTLRDWPPEREVPCALAHEMISTAKERLASTEIVEDICKRIESRSKATPREPDGNSTVPPPKEGPGVKDPPLPKSPEGPKARSEHLPPRVNSVTLPAVLGLLAVAVVGGIALIRWYASRRRGVLVQHSHKQNT